MKYSFEMLILFAFCVLNALPILASASSTITTSKYKIVAVQQNKSAYDDAFEKLIEYGKSYEADRKKNEKTNPNVKHEEFFKDAANQKVQNVLNLKQRFLKKFCCCCN